MKQSILLIEDDPNITDFMEVVLEQERYQLTVASTGMEALTAFQTTSIDLVLLDLGLPDIDGIDLLKILRKRMHLPIIIISARNNEEEKVKALDLGADDYVTKPFGTNELLARIRTALRHQNVQTEALTIVENKNLKIDFEKQLVYKDNHEIHLTKNEYRILALMFRQLGKVVTYQTLMTEVWGPYSDDSQTLRVNMSNIRKKIEQDTLKPEYLITEIGVGYRLRDHRSEQ
ncbi:response regulator transcription factor [Enterococcus hulanensis]|uniref:Response regulator transcription factor n=1 Tax=Enterococcus hulanensis TaxID=2559929 RepID=A0ABU3EUA9_9ENTE|nr:MULTISPECIES: response regulator transcription factor [Enterococcus]MBO0455619.1 response regulator transcription factor [Enterococcus hulanensis]MBX8936809.1 response regulator transcription factor [Enterococcus gilvus]MDT2598277.1 response regulator transcription factor [Enterococcus hulanensis]MDT2608218.1 response regulator transcription factor [Enterococcus hulanensis]MDT2615513.1 response regulator transcription factor [Enterococcus hulanensis]